MFPLFRNRYTCWQLRTALPEGTGKELHTYEIWVQRKRKSFLHYHKPKTVYIFRELSHTSNSLDAFARESGQTSQQQECSTNAWEMSFNKDVLSSTPVISIQFPLL